MSGYRPDSMLHKLHNVVDFSLSENRQTVEVIECCDHYYAKELSKEEFGRLITELQALHAEMPDN